MSDTQKGRNVITTSGGLGGYTVDTNGAWIVHASRYSDATAPRGTHGLDVGPHPSVNLDGWRMIEVVVEGQRLVIPAVEGDHFEYVEVED